MGVKRELIILELEDRASREALEAAAAFKTLGGSINRLSGVASTNSRAFRSMGRDVDGMGASFIRAGTSIDTFSGRLSVLGQSALVLGPALAPIGATMVPAVAGLASGLAGAAGAAAAAGLAFAGVGDALGALNAYQLEPTTANLEKLNQAMAVLGPAGEGFVRYLDSIGGSLERLQRIAGAHMFPGMQAGLESLLGIMPRAESLVAEFSARLGNLSADAGAALGGPEWDSFFAFLQRDAAPIFDEFARSAGNVALGFGNLMAAFAPLSRDFASGMLEASRAFAAWSADSSRFEGFIDYVRQVGPQATEFFVALGEASVALVQAIAPWGSVVLPALTAALNVFTAIADSPIGPALTTAALGFLAFNKAAAASTAIMGRFGPAVGGMSASFGQMRADLGTVATTWATAGAASERESKKMAAATGRLKSNMATIGKGAAGVGAVGVAASGAAQGIGLQNTAMLGLAGTMAGPWGAAAGVGVGLLLDFKAAQDSAKQSASDFAAALDQQTGALTQTNHAMALDALSAEQLQIFKDAGVSIQEMTNAALVGGETWERFRAEMVAANPEFTNSAYGWNFMATEAERAMGAIDGVAKQSAEGRKEFQLEKPAKDAAADSTTRYAAAAREAAAAIEAERNAARATGRQFVGLGKSLDDAKVSLGGWLAEMEKSARDLERFGANAQRAARRGLDNGLIASLNEAGPAGARRMAQLANATDAEIARANAAWRRGQAAIQNYVNTRVPPKQITVDISQAVSNVRAVQAVINSLQGKTVTVTTLQKSIYMSGKQSSIAKGNWPDMADGGTILGARYPYGDKVFIHAAPGEEIISNRYGQADQFRADRAAGRIPAYANGGTVGIPAYANGGTVQGSPTKSLERSLGRLEKAVDRQRDRLDFWNNKRSELRSDVSNSLKLDWLSGGSSNPFSGAGMSGTAAFAQQQWAKQRDNSRLLSRTIANLRKNGAGDAFIAEVLRSEDPLAAAQMFNRQSKGGMLHSQSLFLQATRATASAANSTSSIYADEQRAATSVLRRMDKRVAGLEKAINRNHKDANRSRDKNGARKAVSSGSRSRTRSKRGS
ncbi:hypothetical protein ABT304_21040 [Nocardioides sp. NPDC000445]|uniref:hypothetical protein n=1 Tax=Nocardioides sp. NPDC000445 TaxID=3154257 RepID=UPI00331FD2F3